MDVLNLDLTELLNSWAAGSEQNGEEAAQLVYARLRHIAACHLRNEKADVLLQATAIVHEAYLEMADSHARQFDSRQHFFAFASSVMRRILVSHARQRNSLKRGCQVVHLPLDETILEGDASEVVEIHDALKVLETLDLEKASIVEMRFFAGLSLEEIADVLEVSPSTVSRKWRLARAFLFDLLQPAA